MNASSSSRRYHRAALAVTAAVLLPLALTACSDDSKDSESSGKSTPSAAKDTASSPSDDAAAMSEPFGPACAGVPKEGKGSFDGMAKDPVATAASNNPALSTLV
ncbi:fasciclin domain-containing protein, partial [Streptomyces sp. NPDC052115]